MKIVLSTYGSRGDIQPMLALSLALQSRGHDVLLLGPPEKKAWADHLGCPYQALGQDVTAFIDHMKQTHTLKAALMFNRFVRNEIRQQFKRLPAIVENADIVVGASLVFALSTIAQKMEIPYRYILFTPQLLESRYHPFPAVRNQRLPGWINRLSWQGANILNRYNFAALINHFRKELGLPVLTDAWEHILGTDPIVANDPEVAAIPDDVMIQVTQTGFLHLDIPCPENKALDRFMNDGKKPIYAGFGSMPAKDQKQNIPMLIRAARSLGQRLVIGAFWQTDDSRRPDNDLFYIQNYPHLHLFSRMKAVIHHGGAGTTAAATLSGVPQIIVPHILDQYYHGECIYKKGLGPEPVWRTKLTQKRMTAAMDSVLNDDRLSIQAKKTAAAIAPEKSLTNAVLAIENTTKH